MTTLSGNLSPLVLGLSLIAPLVFVFALARYRARSRPAGWVRVTAPPSGDAPPGIRAAWVGLELPLAAGYPDPVRAHTVGVMTEEPGGSETGYLVDGPTAVARLARRNPAAAAWWGEHAPGATRPGCHLLFPTAVCERVG